MSFSDAAFLHVPFDASCFNFCIIIKVFLVQQSMVDLDNIELFDSEKLTSKLSDTDKLLC